MSDLTEEKRKNLGKKYIQDTQIHRKGAPRFTDKMPNNFRHIGLIHSILPNAKIIDARRYPLDCCFSMFKQLFAQGQEFSYGLSEAGSYYNDYIKLMQHWDDVLPKKVLRVNNEDLITKNIICVCCLMSFMFHVCENKKQKRHKHKKLKRLRKNNFVLKFYYYYEIKHRMVIYNMNYVYFLLISSQ